MRLVLLALACLACVQAFLLPIPTLHTRPSLIRTHKTQQDDTRGKSHILLLRSRGQPSLLSLCESKGQQGMVLLDVQEEVERSYDSILVSPSVAERLLKINVTKLTAVQAEAFAAIREGRDVMARSHTGTGKTLAFTLPIVEAMQAAGHRATKGGVACLIVTPTRELAMQIRKDFQAVAGKSVRVVAAVGGAALEPLQSAIEEGVHVIVGTPGRTVELLRGRTLDLRQLKHFVVDEVDQLLEGGFAEEMDYILECTRRADRFQSILMCATMQPRVRTLARQLCKTNPVTIDLVREGRREDVPKIAHFCTPVLASSRAHVLKDILEIDSPTHALVFTTTKLEAVELAQSLSQASGVGGVECLHGDLPQFQRTRVMEQFKAGRARVLVSTDVAARGIHIDDLELVVHCGIPLTSSGASRRAKTRASEVLNVESYLHRTGRTGRMGASGKSVLLYDPSAGEANLLHLLEKSCGFKFEHRDAPQKSALVHAAIQRVDDKIKLVDPELLSAFEAEAERLVKEGGVKAVAGALAALSGLSRIPEQRSLLTSKEGVQTLRAIRSSDSSILSPSDVMNAVKKILPGAKLGRVSICADGSAVFDLSVKDAGEVMTLWSTKGWPRGEWTVPNNRGN